MRLHLQHQGARREEHRIDLRLVAAVVADHIDRAVDRIGSVVGRTVPVGRIDLDRVVDRTARAVGRAVADRVALVDHTGLGFVDHTDPVLDRAVDRIALGPAVGHIDPVLAGIAAVQVEKEHQEELRTETVDLEVALRNTQRPIARALRPRTVLVLGMEVGRKMVEHHIAIAGALRIRPCRPV